MVATRGHPTGLPEPTDSPSKRSLRSSGPPSSPKTTATTSRSVSSSGGGSGLWAHTPSKFTLLWMGISLPLVLWDTGYVLLRPYSMPGGSLHWPLWTPYELYGTVDHVYGFKQWNLGNGWTAAQGTVNAFETAAYLTYLYLVYKYGQTETAVKGRGAPPVKGSVLGRLSESRTVEGRVAAWAVLLMFGTTQVTFWKTVLYWLIEVYSGFDNIGHNSTVDLIFLWIIPNGAWLVAPLYLIYVFGAEIIQGLESASANEKKEL